MKPSRSHVLIVLTALLAASGGFLLSRYLHPAPQPLALGMPALSIGDTYADLTLKTPSGGSRSLRDWDGQPRLLNFWATWCAPCVKEMPVLAAAQRGYGARGLQVIGIALDSAEAVEPFTLLHAIDYPILLADMAATDPSVLYGNNRGVLPYSVLIGRDGKIKAQKIGDFSAEALQTWLDKNLD